MVASAAEPGSTVRDRLLRLSIVIPRLDVIRPWSQLRPATDTADHQGMVRGQAILLSVLLLGAPAVGETDPWHGAPAAFFGVTFVDTSHEGELGGERADETARVAMIEDYVRTALEEQGLVLVDLAPAAEELARTVNPARCNGCDLRMATRLGARYAVVSEVHKVSNLILSMNLSIRDVETGAMLRGLAVDIRGNTDESWLRGMRYILTRAIFPEH